MNVLLGVTLLLCMVLLGFTLRQSGQFGAAVQDNLLRLRLERVLHTVPAPTDAALLALLSAPDFLTQNPRVAWLGGYYVLNQTFSVDAAKRIWNMAPTYAAEMLVWNARVTSDKPERLRVATAAAELVPDALPARRALIDALIANGEWSTAADELDRLLTTWPANADLLALRGMVEYQGGGSPSRALDLLSHALALDPGNKLVPRYLIDFYRISGDQDELEVLILRLLAENRTPELNAGFYGYLADLYLRQNDLRAAQPAMNSAVALDPQSPWINSLAGEYYYKQNLYEQAAIHYEVASSEYDDPIIWMRLGDSYARLQRFRQATEAYCNVLDHDRTYTDALTGYPNLAQPVNNP